MLSKHKPFLPIVLCSFATLGWRFLKWQLDGDLQSGFPSNTLYVLLFTVPILLSQAVQSSSFPPAAKGCQDLPSILVSGCLSISLSLHNHILFFARVIFDLSKHVSPPLFFAACPCWPLNPLNPSAPSRRFSDWIHMVICAVFCILFIHKTAESFSRTNNRPCLNFFV